MMPRVRSIQARPFTAVTVRGERVTTWGRRVWTPLWVRGIFRRFRRLAKWHARITGTFWLPCAVCGRERSGWEWMAYGCPSIPHTVHRDQSHGVCEDCDRRGVTRTHVWDEAAGGPVRRIYFEPS